MSTTVQAVFEGGVLRPLNDLALSEHQLVEITIRGLADGRGDANPVTHLNDPLEGLRVDTGISDLAENFDEHRFGQRIGGYK